MTNIEKKKVERLYKHCMGISYSEFLEHTDPSGMRTAHVEDPDADAFDYDLGGHNTTPIDILFKH